MGTGKPLVLIHGFGASIGHWRKNIPVLAEAGYQVFAIDLLGFGSSDKPPLNYTMEVWEELVKDFWTAHIQQRAVFVGNSIGGLLSLMVIANHPEIAARRVRARNGRITRSAPSASRHTALGATALGATALGADAFRARLGV